MSTRIPDSLLRVLKTPLRKMQSKNKISIVYDWSPLDCEPASWADVRDSMSDFQLKLCEREVSTERQVQEFFNQKTGSAPPTLEELRKGLESLKDPPLPFEIWQEMRDEAERRERENGA